MSLLKSEVCMLFDYSKYTLRDLQEALRTIDANKYPQNYDALLQQLELRGVRLDSLANAAAGERGRDLNVLEQLAQLEKRQIEVARVDNSALDNLVSPIFFAAIGHCLMCAFSTYGLFTAFGAYGKFALGDVLQIPGLVHCTGSVILSGWNIYRLGNQAQLLKSPRRKNRAYFLIAMAAFQVLPLNFWFLFLSLFFLPVVFFIPPLGIVFLPYLGLSWILAATWPYKEARQQIHWLLLTQPD